MNKHKIRKTKLDQSFVKLEATIKRKFSVSFMSNTKWFKLLTYCASFEEKKYRIQFKLVHDDKVRISYTESNEDFVEHNWFIEPWIYKEIEWLEFSFEDNNTLDELINYLQSKAQFPLEKTETGYRIVGYI
ncbi:hypothetical protein MHO82_22765 [Vibrio sp. Of7-15]|uniref:DUF6678 family protein n=1 Tax=Vibrio sp. Of7-15 TaxID=2724879 RepID=UPI001EF26641|nr:DUF6678 family protein [Vibrio sp. Of7-15]MCG7499691.1 hypothetical protein [Vibrio sp. Of7-15]